MSITEKIEELIKEFAECYFYPEEEVDESKIEELIIDWLTIDAIFFTEVGKLRYAKQCWKLIDYIYCEGIPERILNKYFKKIGVETWERR